MTVSTIKEAWEIANRLFPTDYERDARASQNAGYPVYMTTRHNGTMSDNDHISDLGCRLEVNVYGQKEVNIWIEEEEVESLPSQDEKEEKEMIMPNEMEMDLHLTRAEVIDLCMACLALTDSGEKWGKLREKIEKQRIEFDKEKGISTGGENHEEREKEVKNQMTEYQLTVGLYDKESHKQEIATEKAESMIADCLLNRFEIPAFTLIHCTGVYTHDDGTIVCEPSVRIEIATDEKTDQDILGIISYLKKILNQESIMIKKSLEVIDFK